MDDEDSDFSDSSDDASNAKKPVRNKPVKVDIDLSMTAYANAQNYYNKKRQAAQKEQRTLDASTKVSKKKKKNGSNFYIMISFVVYAIEMLQRILFCVDEGRQEGKFYRSTLQG